MKTNKLMALVIAVIMLFSLAVPSMASYTSVSSGATSLDGTGTGIAWVEKKLINIVFPTQASAASTFDYIVDTQRIIPEVTTYYSGSVSFSGASGGVYFLISGSAVKNRGVSGNVYSSTSKELVVTNKSSCAVDIIANAKTSGGSGVAANTAVSGGAVSSGSPLYLGLYVMSGTSGQSGAVVSGSAGTFVFQTLDGKYDNFKVSDKGDGSYSFNALPSGASGWASTKIYLEGEVAQDINLSGCSIPTVNVTWSYNDPSGMTFLGNAGVVTYASGGVDYETATLESGEVYKIFSPRLSGCVYGVMSGETFVASGSTTAITVDTTEHIATIRPSGLTASTSYVELSTTDGVKKVVQVNAGTSYTAVTATFDSTNNQYKISLPTGVTSTASNVTNLKAGTGTISTYTVAGNGTKIAIAKADVKTALGDTFPTSFDITFTINGVNYKAAGLANNQGNDS